MLSKSLKCPQPSIFCQLKNHSKMGFLLQVSDPKMTSQKALPSPATGLLTTTGKLKMRLTSGHFRGGQLAARCAKSIHKLIINP